jgi:hypothetical protein
VVDEEVDEEAVAEEPGVRPKHTFFSVKF